MNWTCHFSDLFSIPWTMPCHAMLNEPCAPFDKLHLKIRYNKTPLSIPLTWESIRHSRSFLHFRPSPFTDLNRQALSFRSSLEPLDFILSSPLVLLSLRLVGKHAKKSQGPTPRVGSRQEAQFSLAGLSVAGWSRMGMLEWRWTRRILFQYQILHT